MAATGKHSHPKETEKEFGLFLTVQAVLLEKHLSKRSDGPL